MAGTKVIRSGRVLDVIKKLETIAENTRTCAKETTDSDESLYLYGQASGIGSAIRQLKLEIFKEGIE